MISGKGAAWKRLGPLNSELSGVITEQERLNKEQAEKKQKALDEANKKKEEKDKKISGSLASLMPNKTGFRSHDEAIMEFFKKPGGVIDKLVEIKEKIETASGSDKWKLEADLAMLKNTVASIKKYREQLPLVTQKLSQGVANGTYSRYHNRDFIPKYDAMIGQYQYRYVLNDDYSVSLENLGAADFNKDGKPDILNLADLHDPSKLGYFKAGFNSATWIKTAKDHYGTFHEVKDEKGFLRKEYKGFDPEKREGLKDDVNSLFGESYENMTDDFKSYMGDELGIDPDTIKDDVAFQKVKTEFINKVINAYDTTKKNTTDHGAENAAARTKIAKSADARGWAKHKAGSKEEPSLRSGITLRRDSETGNPLRGSGALVGRKYGDLKARDTYMFSAPYDKKGNRYSVIIGSKEVEVQGFDLDDKGRIYVRGSEVYKHSHRKSKSEKEKERTDGESDTSTYTKRDKAFLLKGLAVDSVAKRFGFRNAHDFSQYLSNLRDEELGKANDSSKSTNTIGKAFNAKNFKKQ